MTNEKIKIGDICLLDESREYGTKAPFEVVVLWKAPNNQPIVTARCDYYPFYTTYSQLTEVVGHIDMLNVVKLFRRSKTESENCIGKEALINELKLGYFNKDLQEAKNDPCVVDAMIDWAIRTVKSQPSFTPKTSCEVCREQVLKHLEKEDWADTVKCVMNMPFMKAESEE